jgi:Ca2+/Na+ antiporter
MNSLLLAMILVALNSVPAYILYATLRLYILYAMCMVRLPHEIAPVGKNIV